MEFKVPEMSCGHCTSAIEKQWRDRTKRRHWRTTLRGALGLFKAAFPAKLWPVQSRAQATRTRSSQP